MKSFIKYFILVLAIVPMAACVKLGSGNDNKEDSAGKLVKSIVLEIYEDGKFIDVWYSKWDYSYDESGRVIMDICQDAWKNEYIYGTDQMVKNSTFFEDGELVSSKYYFDNGSLEKAITSYGDYYFSYALSYPSGASKPDLIIEDWESGKFLTNLIWDDKGNLVKVLDEDGFEARIAYTDIKNKCNIDFFFEMEILEFWFYDSDRLCDRNVFQSIVSTNLPVQVIKKYGNSVGITELSYKFDSDGYPIEIKMEDEDYTLIYTITY